MAGPLDRHPALLFWAAATRPLAPWLLTHAAARALDAAPLHLVTALCGAHPALQFTTAPLPTVLARVPRCVDVVACRHARSPRTCEEGEGAPVLRVRLGAEHTAEQCARVIAAAKQLQPAPDMALTCDVHGLRVVQPLVEHAMASASDTSGYKGVVSVTLIGGDEDELADEQAALLTSCHAGVRALRLEGVLSESRAERLQRAAPVAGLGAAHEALTAVSQLSALEHFTLAGNVLCHRDISMLDFALRNRLTRLRTFAWLCSRHSEQRETAGLLQRCMQLLAELPGLQKLTVTDTVMKRVEEHADVWQGIAAQLARMRALTQVVLAGTRARRGGVGGWLGLDWGVALGAGDGVEVVAPAVGALTRLAVLDLSRCSDDGGDGGGGAALVRDLSAAVPHLQQLRALDVSGNALAAQFMFGAAATPACVVAAQLWAACAPLTALTRLALAECGLKGTVPGAEAAFAELAGLTGLRWLELSRNPIRKAHVLLPLGDLLQLQHLGLQEVQLLQRDFAALAGALVALTALTSLDLSCNGGVHEEALQALAAQLGLDSEAGAMRAAQAAP